MQALPASTCKICYYAFDSEERLPVVGSCGHTSCRSCCVHFMNGNCATCRRTGAFKNAPTNFALLDVIQEGASLWEKFVNETADTEPSAPPLEEDEADKPLLSPTPSPSHTCHSIAIVIPPSFEGEETIAVNLNEFSFCARHMQKIVCATVLAVVLFSIIFGALVEWWSKHRE